VDWTQQYADRVMTLDEAAALVHQTDRVMVGLPEPAPWLEALGARADLADVEIFVPAPRDGAVAAGANQAIRLLAPFLTDQMRLSKTPVEILPVHLSGWGPMAERWSPRVRAVLIGEPDAAGIVHPGGSLAADDELVRGQRSPDSVVIGLVDPHQPRMPGFTYNVTDFDVLVPLSVDTPRTVYDLRKEPAAIDDFVAAVGELIPDKSTLQSGIGSVPEAIMARLTHKRDLGVHTEVLGGGMAALVDSDAVSNRYKGHYDGNTVFTIVLPEAVEFASRHPSSLMLPTRLVLDPREVARNRLMRCVNSAVQVDLFGQGNAEMIGGVQYSGVGGQLDFLRACTMADDALSILVLESVTSKNISRIVPRLDVNAATATRYDTQVVVTEYGVAWLRDATMRQKAQRLIAIAHPDHRARLEEEASKMGLGQSTGRSVRPTT
jgi:4-hydroxybutyrate CoA-transferase